MDTIIERQENVTLESRGAVTLLHFYQGMVLLVGADAIGLYRDERAIHDPLANGVIGYEAIPAPLRPQWQQDSGYVGEHIAGYVGLEGGSVVFIRPDGIALYPCASDALNDRNRCWLIPFPPLNA